MASTYSNLKFELIGTGEQVGTWGNTTNTNLGTAIEQAIVGTASVSFSSADVTLTLTNTNAAQNARALRLNLTGTSGGARNLILGSGCQIDKPYIVNNGLADTVTVKNTTGTGVAVPAGKTMWVYNNGTNVVDAVTHLSSLTLGSALPIASGGTGSTSTTFVNLATNVTGTLPIANGGTGSTSTTFVNLATNVTGTLPVANGGTGQTTYTNGQLLIGNTTGGTLVKATLTASTGISITNGAGSISIAATNNGTVTSVSGTGTINGVTLSGTVTSTGNITLGGAINASTINTGTLPVARGGTGLTTVGTSGNVLTSNGSAWVSQAISAGGNYIVRTYTAPATWTKPTGLKAVKVTVVGGGGGAGGAWAGGSQPYGGVGACGGTAIKLAIAAPSIPGPVAVTVGAGGTAGAAATPGSFNITAGTGGTSSFGPFVSATGGQGAFSSPSGPAAFRTPGSGSGGDFNYGSPELESGAFNTRKIATPNLESGVPGSITGYASWLYPAGYGRARRAGLGLTQLGEAAATNSGGSAGATISNGPSIAGQAGAAGIVIVEEFY